MDNIIVLFFYFYLLQSRWWKNKVYYRYYGCVVTYTNKNEDVSHVLDSRKMTRIVPTHVWLWQKLNDSFAHRQGRLAVGDCFHMSVNRLASPEWKYMFQSFVMTKSASDSLASQLCAGFEKRDI